jgi:hypothetical protein
VDRSHREIRSGRFPCFPFPRIARVGTRNLPWAGGDDVARVDDVDRRHREIRIAGVGARGRGQVVWGGTEGASARGGRGAGSRRVGGGREGVMTVDDVVRSHQKIRVVCCGVVSSRIRCECRARARTRHRRTPRFRTPHPHSRTLSLSLHFRILSSPRFRIRLCSCFRILCRCCSCTPFHSRFHARFLFLPSFLLPFDWYLGKTRFVHVIVAVVRVVVA